MDTYLKGFRILVLEMPWQIQKNLISDEIKSRIAAGNKCFYNLRQIYRSSAMSKTLKSTTYKKMVKPAVVFGSETWTMTEMDMKSLGTWEKKILR
jgi:hypothetical protein